MRLTLFHIHRWGFVVGHLVQRRREAGTMTSRLDTLMHLGNCCDVATVEGIALLEVQSPCTPCILWRLQYHVVIMCAPGTYLHTMITYLDSGYGRETYI